MKRPFQLFIVLAMVLLVATPAEAQTKNNSRKTRFIYLWDVTGSLVPLKDRSTGERDYTMYNKTFDYMAKDIERKIKMDRDYEVIVYPFNDKLYDSICITSWEDQCEELRKEGSQMAVKHIDVFNKNMDANKYNVTLEGGGCTNIGSATKMAESLFGNKDYNTIVILITDGCNEYPYDYIHIEGGTTKPLEADTEGRKELRKCIRKANEAACNNTSTVNRFIYVVFGDDNPYMDKDGDEARQATLDAELKSLYEDGRTKIIYPETSSTDIMFYDLTVSAENKAQKAGEVFHMNSRDGQLDLLFEGLDDGLKQDVVIKVKCEGDCLQNNVEDKYIVEERTTITGLEINPKYVIDGSAKFDISVEIVEGSVYDTDELYYEVFISEPKLEATVTKQFSGQITIRVRE